MSFKEPTVRILPLFLSYREANFMPVGLATAFT